MLNIQTNGQRHILDIMKEDLLDTLQLSMLDLDNGKDYFLPNTQDTLQKIIMLSMLDPDSLKAYTHHTMKEHMH